MLLLISFYFTGLINFPIIAIAAESPTPPFSLTEFSEVNSFSQSIYLPVIYSKKPQPPRVNALYTEGKIRSAETAITWFGQVTPTENYADVRVGYNAEELWINLTVFDRFLWYDPNSSLKDLTTWDAASLYLYLPNTSGAKTHVDIYRFDAQLNWWEARDNYQAVYKGSDNSWNKISLPFSTISGWRGNAPNDNQADHGWSITYIVPFTSFGLSETPPPGEIWSMAINLYDRDDAAGSPIPVKSWPNEAMEPGKIDTWGELAFGLPSYSPPLGSSASQTLTIRHKLNEAEVVDGMVGGGNRMRQLDRG